MLGVVYDLVLVWLTRLLRRTDYSIDIFGFLDSLLLFFYLTRLKTLECGFDISHISSPSLHLELDLRLQLDLTGHIADLNVVLFNIDGVLGLFLVLPPRRGALLVLLSLWFLLANESLRICDPLGHVRLDLAQVLVDLGLIRRGHLADPRAAPLDGGKDFVLFLRAVVEREVPEVLVRLVLVILQELLGRDLVLEVQGVVQGVRVVRV